MYLEQYILGEMLENNNTIQEYIALGLNSSYFQYNINKLLFLDIISNKENLIKSDICKRIDIEPFFLNDIISIYNNQMPKLTKTEVVEKLIELFKKEKLKDYLKEIIEDIDFLPLQTILEKIEKSSDYIANNEKSNNKVYKLNEFLDIEEIDQNTIQNPFKTFSPFFNFVKGSLITVGSRTSMGKTAFCLDLGLKLSKTNNVLYVNLEMSNKSIYNRLVSNISEIPLNLLKEKSLTPEQEHQMNESLESMKKLKFNILNCDNTNFETVVNQIKQIHYNQNQDIIIIDYLTRLQYKSTNRNLEVEYIVNRLAELSKELNVCIVVVSQLSREIEKRTDKSPMLADLRDSGGIEQASDIVLLLYRPDYYNKKLSVDNNTIMYFNIAKNRDGETIENLKLVFNKNNQKFKDI